MAGEPMAHYEIDDSTREYRLDATLLGLFVLGLAVAIIFLLRPFGRLVQNSGGPKKPRPLPILATARRLAAPGKTRSAA